MISQKKDQLQTHITNFQETRKKPQAVGIVDGS